VVSWGCARITNPHPLLWEIHVPSVCRGFNTPRPRVFGHDRQPNSRLVPRSAGTTDTLIRVSLLSLEAGVGRRDFSLFMQGSRHAECAATAIEPLPMRKG
jgi:hypothetical protein